MLKDRSKDKFYGRSHLVRLRGKYTVQTAHCALHNIAGANVTGKGINPGCMVGLGGQVQVQGPVQGHRGHPEVIWEGWATLKR